MCKQRKSGNNSVTVSHVKDSQVAIGNSITQINTTIGPTQSQSARNKPGLIAALIGFVNPILGKLAEVVGDTLASILRRRL